MLNPRHLLLAAAVLSAPLLRADVSLPGIISDHMVLQKSPATAIWGKAAPGEAVTVSIAGVKAQATADEAGKWRTKLDLSQAAPGPHELVVEGKNRLVVNDVLLGEVWITSGQSNMQMQLRYALDSAPEIAASANPNLRQFAPKAVSSPIPLEEMDGKWVIASPETSGSFSAVGYYFGRDLQKELNIPVGLVYLAIPGTGVQVWTSYEALDKADDYSRAERDRLVNEVKTFPQRSADYQKAFPAWADKYQRADRPTANIQEFLNPASTEGWVPVKLPGRVAGPGLPESGIFWLRRTIDIPADQAGKRFMFVWDENDPAFWTVYWNGEQVDELKPDMIRRVIPWEPRGNTVIPPKLVKAGPNTVVMRLYSPFGPPNFRVNPGKAASIAGEWLVKAEQEFPALDAEAKASYPGLPPFRTWDDSIVPTLYYNSLINPILNLTAQGVVWYQGEGNTSRAYSYRNLLPILIEDWRIRFGSELAFYIVQLPINAKKQDQPGDSTWAELREAQSMTLSLPKTGMAVTIDGRDPQLHPRDKSQIGQRLARVALAKTYGAKIPYSGPVYKSMEVKDGKVILSFSEVGSGLVGTSLPETIVSYENDKPITEPAKPVVPGSELQGFAICGADQVWKWANAKIDGDKVVVWSADVPQPVAVRYAWADYPTCNLANKDGFPASPFRTDDWETPTQKRK